MGIQFDQLFENLLINNSNKNNIYVLTHEDDDV